MKSPDRIMRAMRASDADASSLRYESLPVPSPGAGEVLVQVRATAVTPGELTGSWPAPGLR